MRRHDDNDLCYAADCLLATIDHFADLSAPPKKEVLRQAVITQMALNTMQRLGSAPLRGRAADVFNHHKGDLISWANRFCKAPAKPIISVDILTGDYAESETKMIEKILAFTEETIANPSAKMAGASEMSRQRLIADRLRECLVNRYAAESVSDTPTL